MPRVRINALAYKCSDLRKFIKKKLAEQGKTQEDMAVLLGISQPSFSHRLQKSLFSYSELLVIFSELECTDKEIVSVMKKERRTKC